MTLAIETASCHFVAVGTYTQFTASVPINPNADIILYYVHSKRVGTTAAQCTSFVVDGNTLPGMLDTGNSTWCRIQNFHSTGSWPATSSMTASFDNLASIAISVVQISGADITNPFYAMTVNNKTGGGNTEASGALDHLENNLLIAEVAATPSSSADNPWTFVQGMSYNHAEVNENAETTTGYTYPGFTGWNSGSCTLSGAALWKSILVSINSASGAPPPPVEAFGFTYDYSQFLAFD